MSIITDAINVLETAARSTVAVARLEAENRELRRLLAKHSRRLGYCVECGADGNEHRKNCPIGQILERSENGSD